MLAFLAGKMFDIYQTYAIAYYSASILLVLAAIMVFFLKSPHHTVGVTASNDFPEPELVAHADTSSD
jgi:hypothetical protein